MLAAVAVILAQGQIIHPALWVQLWFESTGALDLYVDALSAAHVGGEETVLTFEGIDDDGREENTDDDT